MEMKPKPFTFDVELADVVEFHRKFGILNFDLPGHLSSRKLGERIECMQEELKEFIQAAQQQDLAGMADALIDLVYFVKGTAAMLGLPWEQLWADVHAANMRKVPGVTHRGHQVDVTKPPGWVGPQTMAILSAAGYDLSRWTDLLGHIDEERCRDDLR